MATSVGWLGRLSLLLLCTCALVSGIDCVAQNNAVHVSQLAHKAWRLREGAVPGAPNAVAQTKDGYIWVGTENGLYRFDGEAYQLVGANGADQMPPVQALLADRDGSLWIGTNSGLYQLRDGALHKLSGKGRIGQIFQAPSGDIWIAQAHAANADACRIHAGVFDCSAGKGIVDGGLTIASDGGGGFWLSDGDKLRHRNGDGSAAPGDTEMPWRGQINVLGSNNRDRVWAGVREAGQLSKVFEHGSQGWHAIAPLPGLRNSTEIQTIFSDNEGALWIGTTDCGLYRINGPRVDRFDQSDGLSANYITDITQDAEGSIWVATSGGIDQLHRSLVDSWSTREGLSADSVSAIVADSSGRIWMSNEGGLDVLENGEVHSYTPRTGLPGTSVTGITADREGRIWVGVDHGLWILDQGKFSKVPGVDGSLVVQMREDTTGQMWIRAGNALYRSLHGSLQRIDWKDAGRITAMYADPQGGMWIGARGLTAFHVAGDATKILVNNKPVDDKPFDEIYRVGNKLVSQTTHGLSLTGSEATATLDQKNGLPYSLLHTSSPAINGDVYLMTENSYLRIAAPDFERWLQSPGVQVPSIIIDGMDGAVPGQSTFAPASTTAPNGDIWFATDRFPQRIEPKRLSLKRNAPPIFVQAVLANGIKLDDSPLVLQPGTSTLEIRYAALSYINPQKVQYRYLLEGVDTDWQNAGTRRQAIYDRLPPGRYRFRVMAGNGTGAWTSHEAVLEFRLEPHLYQTMWFKLMLGVLALFVLWMIYLARLRYLIGRAKAHLYERMSERERIARDLHDTFFQGIQGLLLRFQTGTSALPAAEPTRPMFEDLLKQSDEVMHEGRELVLDLRSRFADDEDLAQALASVCAELEPLFPAKYSVTVQGKTKPLQSRIGEETFRIAKEAITNAFLHSGATTVEVEISFGDRDFKLRVRDDGRGIAPAIQEAGGRVGHFGLTGMRERAKKVNAKLDIWSQSGAGTEVEVSIPAAQAFPATSRYFSWLSQLRDKQI